MAHANRASLMTPVVAQLTGRLRRRTLIAFARMWTRGRRYRRRRWRTPGDDRPVGSLSVILALGAVRNGVSAGR